MATDEAATSIYKELGENVRIQREELGLTQRELAARLTESGWKLDPTAVSKIEAGKRVINVNQLELLARALEIRPHRLVANEVERYRRTWNSVYRKLEESRASMIDALDDLAYLYHALGERERGSELFRSVFDGLRMESVDDMLRLARVQAKEVARKKVTAYPYTQPKRHALGAELLGVVESLTANPLQVRPDAQHSEAP